MPWTHEYASAFAVASSGELPERASPRVGLALACAYEHTQSIKGTPGNRAVRVGSVLTSFDSAGCCGGEGGAGSGVAGACNHEPSVRNNPGKSSCGGYI